MLATVIVPRNILNADFTWLSTGFILVNYLPLLLILFNSEKAVLLLLTEKIIITVVQNQASTV